MSYYDEQADRYRPTKQDVAECYENIDDDQIAIGDWVNGRRFGCKGHRKRAYQKRLADKDANN